MGSEAGQATVELVAASAGAAARRSDRAAAARRRLRTDPGRRRRRGGSAGAGIGRACEGGCPCGAARMGGGRDRSRGQWRTGHGSSAPAVAAAGHRRAACRDQLRGREASEVNGTVVLVTWVGGASGSRAAAAALACAGSEPDRPGLLIDVGGRPPRPTLVASTGARELEERLAIHMPEVRAASRGQTCHLALPADEEGLERLPVALPLVRDSIAIVHLPPALLQPALAEPRIEATGALLRADLANDRALTGAGRSRPARTGPSRQRSSSGRWLGFRPGERSSACCRLPLRWPLASGCSSAFLHP